MNIPEIQPYLHTSETENRESNHPRCPHVLHLLHLLSLDNGTGTVVVTEASM